MNDTASRTSLRIGSLILVPALITLAVTILRLAGELGNWSSLLFNKSAGGGFALVGISWLPIIFGPYFGWKLASSGDGPASAGKAVGGVIGGVIVWILGGVAFFFAMKNESSPNLILVIVGIILWLGSAFVARTAWRRLGNTLFAYAFAARIPVLIVMFLAMSGKGGQGWGTHYDVAGPGFHSASLAKKFIELAVIPQMSLWIGYTVVLGALIGWLFMIVFRRRAVTAAAA